MVYLAFIILHCNKLSSNPKRVFSSVEEVMQGGKGQKGKRINYLFGYSVTVPPFTLFFYFTNESYLRNIIKSNISEEVLLTTE